MGLASGQMPYEYPFTVPLRSQPDSWPGNGTGWVLGASGDVMEQGMFVINAELRKWGFNDENLLQNFYKVYTHPEVTPSGFEPKPNGDTLEGHVGDVAALADIDNINQMRFMLDELFNRYDNDTDYFQRHFQAAWLTTAYPESPSGYIRFQELSPGTFLVYGFDYLRPDPDFVGDGENIEDLDIHWLGSSGVIFDVDFGEVIFNPYPFPGESVNNRASANSLQFDTGPLYPTFHKTDGSLISMTGRERSDWDSGFADEINFNAFGSGKIQLDGYALLPETKVRIVTGADNGWFFVGDGSSDFVNPVQGVRQLSSNGDTDGTARMYYDVPGSLGSGFYRILTSTSRSAVPEAGIASGAYTSLWPPGGYQERINANGFRVYAGWNNNLLRRSTYEASDGTRIVFPDLSRGYQVFDDCLWITGITAGLSGSVTAGGLHPISPHNGNFMWFRSAERTIASRGNRPSTSSEGPDAPEPGHWEVHRGLEKFGSNEILRVSRSWQEDFTINACGPGNNNDLRESTVYFQRYELPELTHTEQAETVPFCEDVAGGGDFGTLGNALSSLFFDGTHYFIGDRLLGRVSRWTSALDFDGIYTGRIAARRYYVDGEYLYSIAGAITTGDPLITDANMAGRGSASGIGKFSFTTHPSDILTETGNHTHDSAKPIEADKHVGNQSPSNCDIHHIIYVDSSDATHVAPGIWVLIQFGNDLYLMRVVEEATIYRVEESYELDLFADSGFPFGDDFPYEIIHLDID